MANYVYITLDTTAPQNPTISIAGGAAFTSSQTVALSLSVTDTPTTGYTMKIWGDVDKTDNVNIQDTEAASQWITFSPNQQVKLAAGSGTKTLNVKVRDDVFNASTVAVDSIQLDADLPSITIITQDVTRISRQATKDTLSFSFTVSEDYTEFKVKLVNSIDADQTAGTVIPTTDGSTGTAGTGTFIGTAAKSVTVKAADLVTAGASTDGQKILKVFVKDLSGQWSV